MNWPTRLVVGMFTLSISGAAIAQGLLSRDLAAQRAAILASAKTAEGRDLTDAARMEVFRKNMQEASSLVDTRHDLLALAVKHPGKELDGFLREILAGDPDAGIRGRAATSLGKLGSAENLAMLLESASNDKQTSMMIGDVGSSMSARRNATFAVAELAVRFPAVQDKAAAGLRGLAIPRGFENESLDDARQQALFQITRDKSLLTPFLEKLKSPDAKAREAGVIAFRFFKLDVAPPELVSMLIDPSADVRRSTAMVLGEIGDVQTLEPLKKIAADEKESVGARSNAIVSIGRMKRPESAAFVETLLADPDLTIRGNAAVAYYRITGRKTKDFPEGYNAD